MGRVCVVDDDCQSGNCVTGTCAAAVAPGCVAAGGCTAAGQFCNPSLAAQFQCTADPRSCLGCVELGMCFPGNTAMFCGSLGAACQSAGATTACFREKILPNWGAQPPNTACHGCIDRADQCWPGTADEACGFNAPLACSRCAANQSCNGLTCQ
jgi:hypothetical protein